MRHILVIVLRVQMRREHDLLDVVQVHEILGLVLGLGQGGQQKAGKNGDDGDHDQKLDQGERSAKTSILQPSQRLQKSCISHRLINCGTGPTVILGYLAAKLIVQKKQVNCAFGRTPEEAE